MRERVDRAAARFHLTPLLDRSLHGLSEGQKQKTALASIISREARARLPATGGGGPVRIDGLRFAYRGGPELFDGASFSLPRGSPGC